MSNLNPNDDEFFRAAMGGFDDETDSHLYVDTTLETGVMDRQEECKHASVVSKQYSDAHKEVCKCGRERVVYEKKANDNKNKNNNLSKKTKRKKWIGTIVAVIIFTIIGVGALTLLGNHNNNFVPATQTGDTMLSVDEQIEQETNVINSVNKGFIEVEETFLVNDTIPEGKLADVLKAEYEYAESLINDGVATDAVLENTGCITVSLTQGDKYIYIPKISGMKASGETGRILTLQPHKSEFPDNSTDKLAKRIVSSYKYYEFDPKDNLDENEVTLESILNLKNSEVIIWDGHGSFTEDNHSILITGETAKHVKSIKKKTHEFENDEFIYTSGKKPKVAIDYTFFNNHFDKNDFNNAVIFLGTCYSGKDDVLAKTLTNKGAKTVFVATNSIDNSYCNKMTKTIFESLIKGWDAGDSLDVAKKRHGKHDSRKLRLNSVDISSEGIDAYFEEEKKNIDLFFHPAEIKIIGSNEFKLRKNKKTTSSKDFLSKPYKTTNIGEYDSLVDKLCAEEWVVVLEGDFTYFKFSNDSKVKMTHYVPEEETITAKYDVIDDNTVYFGLKNGIGSVTRLTISNRSERDIVDVEIEAYGETITGTMEWKSNLE